MPRDYKHRARPRKKNQSVPGWVWLLAGLLLGLFIAFLVYLKQNPTEPERPVASNPTTDTREVRKSHPISVPPPPEPRYRFYDLLPDMEVVVPEPQEDENDRLVPIEKPGTYYLQVGSFKTAGQADQQKARMALLGLEADIQTVTIDGQQTWHRVRVGPFKDLHELNRIRSQLQDQGMEAIILKVKS